MKTAIPMTPQSALLGVLVLALTAETDERAALAGELADDIAASLTADEIKHAQAQALEIQDLAESMFWAEAPSDIAAIVAGTCGISAIDDENSLLVFENRDDRDEFVSTYDEAQVANIHDVCAELTKRYQRKAQNSIAELVA